MFHSEEAARTKWCPFVRTIDFRAGDWTQTPVAAVNRIGGKPIDDERLVCVGSRCMAWVTSPSGSSGYCGLVNLRK